MAGRKRLTPAVKPEVSEALTKPEPKVLVPTVVGPEYVSGYPPERLDPILTGMCATAVKAEKAVAGLLPLLDKVTERLKEVEEKGDAHAHAEAVSRVVKQASDVLVGITRAMDSLSRLRSFVAGGPDRRTEEIEYMSDRQLMAMILGAVGRCPRCNADLTTAA